MDASSLSITAAVLATYLVHSSVLLGGAWLLVSGRCLRSARLRQAGWKMAMLLGLVTAPLQVGLGITPWSGRLELAPVSATTIGDELPNRQSPKRRALLLEPAAQPGHVSAYPSAATASDVPAAAQAADAYSGPDSHVALPHRLPRMTASQGDPVLAAGEPRLAWFRVALVSLAIWLVGAVLGMARLLILWLRLRVQRGLVELARGPERRMLDQLRRRAGLNRPVWLYRTSSSCPIAWGWRRWHIALPSRLLGRLRPGELSALLAHELGHLARGDTRWLWLGGWVTAVAFFQPLNRLAQRHIRRESELLSDSWAISHTGDRLALARSLTVVAELMSAQRPVLAAAALADRATLADRVARLLDDRPLESPTCGRRGRWLLGGLGVAACTAFLISAPGVHIARSAPAGVAISRAPFDAASHDPDAWRADERPADERQASPAEPGLHGDSRARVLQASAGPVGLWRELELAETELRQLQVLASKSADPRLDQKVRGLIERWKLVVRRGQKLRRSVEAVADGAAAHPPPRSNGTE